MFSKLICQSIIKVWSTFSKVVGVGKAHKYFPFMQSNDSQTARCLRLINCCIGRFYGRCPNPQFLKKLSKLFCFWENNLALAEFQFPTDTPLSHNLIFFKIYFLPTSKVEPQSCKYFASFFVINIPFAVSINSTFSYPISSSFCLNFSISPYLAFDIKS